MKKKNMVFMSLIYLLISTGVSASLEGFIGLDGKEYCSEEGKNEFVLCKEISNEENPFYSTKGGASITTINNNPICLVSGKEQDMKECAWLMRDQAGPTLGHAILFGYGLIAIGFILEIFWIFMLFDIIKYQKDKKVLWIIIVLMFNILGAFIYYFAEKRQRNKKETTIQIGDNQIIGDPIVILPSINNNTTENSDNTNISI